MDINDFNEAIYYLNSGGPGKTLSCDVKAFSKGTHTSMLSITECKAIIRQVVYN